jgi:DNA polymerase III subunit gamma/tau
MATYQSLYRRYRSQRFDEVLGQDHITRALRNAVREGRVGHAYLFSGPRGTGKTSTARILAKVLNCADPQDGEPCGTCDNCIAVADGRVSDWLLEQDAASKSKVDDMRDLLERVPLGTSGNRKVIILDEVHMLSQGAENALLKTLEEPPDHVVFVLATTDPQKVRPTIKSRTQHFEFHLLPPDVLAAHVRHVIDDAGLGLDDDAVEHVVRVGGGSARDTLSALDQVAALGEVVSDREPVDAVIDALCDRDAGAALVAVAEALAVGRDPRTLGEDVIAGLRNAFLAVMGVGETHLAPADRARASDVGERLGAAGLTRALEVLGEALTELARKPDPRIVVEVALVRLTRADADRSLDAVLERLDRLERGLPAASGSSGPTPAAAASPSPAPSARPSSAPAGGGAPVASAPAAAAPPKGTGPGAGAAPGGGSVASARAALAAQRKAAAAADTPAAATPAAPATPATPSAPTPTPSPPEPTAAPAAGRPTLGSVARTRAGGARSAAPAAAPTSGRSQGPAAPASEPAAPDVPAKATSGKAAPAKAAPAAPSGAPPAGAGATVAPDQLAAAWGDLLAGLPISVRSKWRAGHWADPAADTLRFAVDNEWHQKVCEDTRRDVEQALAGHFGQAVKVAVVVDDAGAPAGSAGGGGAGGRSGPSGAGRGSGDTRRTGGGRPGAGAPPDDDEHIDPSELRDAGDATVGGVDLLMREFGGELVEGEQR